MLSKANTNNSNTNSWTAPVIITSNPNNILPKDPSARQILQCLPWSHLGNPRKSRSPLLRNSLSPSNHSRRLSRSKTRKKSWSLSLRRHSPKSSTTSWTPSCEPSVSYYHFFWDQSLIWNPSSFFMVQIICSFFLGMTYLLLYHVIFKRRVSEKGCKIHHMGWNEFSKENQLRIIFYRNQIQKWPPQKQNTNKQQCFFSLSFLSCIYPTPLEGFSMLFPLHGETYNLKMQILRLITANIPTWKAQMLCVLPKFVFSHALTAHNMPRPKPYTPLPSSKVCLASSWRNLYQLEGILVPHKKIMERYISQSLPSQGVTRLHSHPMPPPVSWNIWSNLWMSGYAFRWL